MAEETKKQKKQYGMGPGQSMAMAGNTGLASFKEKDINRVQQAKRDYNQFTGADRNQNASYTDIGQEIGELGSKYRRPVKISDGFGAYSDGSGRRYTPNDFNGDGSFRSFTATQPTFSQVFGRDGDVRRAFKGYNSMNYNNPGQANSQISMQRTPGMMDVGGGIMGMLANMAVPGAGFLMNMMQGAGNGLQGGIQDLIDYRPTMVQPRDDGIKGGIDRLFNLGKGMLGAPNYKEDLGATNYGTNPMMFNNAPITMAGLTDKQKMLLDQRRNMYPGMLGIQEMLDNLPKGDPNDPATYQDVETYLT